MEKTVLHPAMFSQLVDINEKSFDLNDYAEGLQKFEAVLEEYGKGSSGSGSGSGHEDYFADVDALVTSAFDLESAQWANRNTVPKFCYENSCRSFCRSSRTGTRLWPDPSRPSFP